MIGPTRGEPRQQRHASPLQRRVGLAEIQERKVVDRDNFLGAKHRQEVERHVQHVEVESPAVIRYFDGTLPVHRSAGERDKLRVDPGETISSSQPVSENEVLVTIPGLPTQVPDQVRKVLFVAPVPHAHEMGIDSDAHHFGMNGLRRRPCDEPRRGWSGRGS